MTSLTKICLMAGGTGGHVVPALTIAQACQAQHIACEWLGSVGGLENELVPKANIPLHVLPIKGLRRKGALGWVFAPWILAKTVWQARRILQRMQPDVVVGMGGFASFPGGIAARLLKLPLIIHEQNAAAGLANRLLSVMATRVLSAFPQAFKKSPAKLHVIGNPVRENILHIPAPRERLMGRSGALRVLVLGGSQGANAINTALLAALAQLPATHYPVIWHSTGARHYEEIAKAYQLAGIPATVDAYIQDMAAAYSWADVVIGRSGALTVSELAAVGLASILVPYPNSVDDHQRRNALFLVNADAALLCEQADFTPAWLAQCLQKFSEDRPRLLMMAENAWRLRCADATAAVLAACAAACEE